MCVRLSVCMLLRIESITILPIIVHVHYSILYIYMQHDGDLHTAYKTLSQTLSTWILCTHSNNKKHTRDMLKMCFAKDCKCSFFVSVIVLFVARKCCVCIAGWLAGDVKVSATRERSRQLSSSRRASLLFDSGRPRSGMRIFVFAAIHCWIVSVCLGVCVCFSRESADGGSEGRSVRCLSVGLKYSSGAAQLRC